jgi:hypothetical protein
VPTFIGSASAASTNQQPGEGAVVAHGIDTRQHGQQRRELLLFDGVLIEIRGAEVRHLAPQRARRRVCGVFEQRRHLPLRQRGDFIARVPAGTPGGDFVRHDPGGVGVGVEIIRRAKSARLPGRPPRPGR